MAISDLDYTDDSDLALIRRTRTGDRDAYGILHERHVGSARALAWRMSRSSSDADDLVSEGFARVLAALQRGSGPEVAFRPYLLSTIRRLAYDRTNREKREAPVEYEIDEPTEPGGDPVVEGFERDTAAAAFASLPERWRMVLWHTEVEGQSPAQVAELLGIKPNAVAALAYRAREGLRQAYLGQHATVTPAAENECRVTTDRLAAYVRGGLTTSQKARVQRHLEDCDDCRAAYLELASVNTSMRSVIGLVVLGPAAGLYLAELAVPTAPATLGAVHPPSGSSAAAQGARIGKQARILAVAAAVLLALVGGAALAASRSSDRELATGERTSEDRPAADAASGAGRGPSGADDGSDASDPAGPDRPAADPAPTVPDRASGSNGGTGPGSVDPGGVTPAVPASPVPGDPARPGRRQQTTLPTTPSTAPPTTTPPPATVPVVPSQLRVAMSSAGGLVGDRPGVLVAAITNQGAGVGRAVQVQVDLVGATLRGLPHVATNAAGTRAAAPADDEWVCTSRSTTSLSCTRGTLAPGASGTIYIPVTAGAGPAPASVTASITGTDDQPDPGASPTVTIPVGATGMAARYATIDHGAQISAGNSLLTCDDTETGCAAVRAGTQVGDNGSFAMVPVDIDGDPATTNSSAATLGVPQGAEVVSATLYQGGDTAGGPGGAPAPDPAAVGQLVVRTPSGAAVRVAPERVDRVGSRYQSVADITDLVAREGGGTWTVGGAQLGTGTNMFGGWTIVVVYRDAALPLRSLVVLDGLSEVTTTAQATDSFDVGGFTVPASGSKSAAIDVVVYEGDLGLAGDQLSVGGQPLANGANPLGNSFNSSASDRGVSRPGLSPGVVNLFGLDIDRFDVSGVLAPGATSTRIALTTTADVYLPGVVAISVDQ